MTAGGLSAVDGRSGAPSVVWRGSISPFRRPLRQDARPGSPVRESKRTASAVATGGAFAIEPHTAEELFHEMAQEAQAPVFFEARSPASVGQGARIEVNSSPRRHGVFAHGCSSTPPATFRMATSAFSTRRCARETPNTARPITAFTIAPGSGPRLGHEKPGSNGRLPDGLGVWDRDISAGPACRAGRPEKRLRSACGSSRGEPGNEGDLAPGVQAHGFRLCSTTCDDRILDHTTV